MHSNGWGTFMKKIITIGLISMLLVGCDSETQTEEKTFVLELGNEVDKVVLDDQYSLVDFDDNSYECGKTLMVQPISATILKMFK